MTETTENRYDVVIVGGRPAGASLAIRLGMRGARVLILDRDDFPSLPSVPSSPIIHPGTLRELDDLGLDESIYSSADARVEGLVLEFHGYFKVRMQMPEMHGRRYLYGANRADFDFALWQHLERYPTVTRWTRATMIELTRDVSGRVDGLIVQREGAATEIKAGCVVGADGRFSQVARKAGAEVALERKDHCSTVYYANWEDVGPVRDDADRPVEKAIHILATGRGLDVLSIPVPGNKVSINTHQRADRVDIAGDAQGYYARTLQSFGSVKRRLEWARQADQVVGIKKIGNGYRTSSGRGWVLVGDALHYKDPVDGQGIYDALVCSRALDRALGKWLFEKAPFESAMAGYDQAAQAETRDMFDATTDRLKQELYQDPPRPVIQTMIRWMLTDPAYHERFLRFLGRDIPPKNWLSKGLMAECIARGIGRDLRGLVRPRTARPA